MLFPEEARTVSKFVLEAADEILRIYRSEFAVREKKKGDPVTEADLAANRILVRGIRESFGDPVFSEEDILPFDQKSHRNGRVWILDPIDGTREFVAKNPEFALSLGLVENGTPIFGIIMNPATGEFFWGRDGVGSNLQILQPPYSKLEIDWNSPHYFLAENEGLRDSDTAREVLVSVSETRDGLFQDLDFGPQYKRKATGSIAYKLALVAVGKAAMTLSLRPKNDWDIAGGIAILRASKGFDLEIKTGDPFRFLDSELSVGLLAGRENRVLEFWGKNSERLRNSVRENW
ncbi:3'(2'),5'-bisphosphate nucleotidase CysQ [Leptospira fletcheri]|uniref:3'(2'),5'-bisphosphate nucleotidase CysQ n=1 Tax=Leptospira fletcheri TaxID=2484981 RepID=A0A4R9G4B2_9LEPT|nr:3'(2'),5'-bisphosphate nucleotidase CysQ [Leptospira fletcheri]TGK06173.1 3'(2'),5'-bisphosphate nucleotidase CysQ [Leptospira fletcheri]